MNICTKLIHIFGLPDKETKSIVPPIHLSTSFAMDEPTSNEGFQYGRVGNPTREVLEKTLAELEGAKFAAVFSSGSATFTSLLATLKHGDQIICHIEIYEGTIRIIEKVFKNFGIEVKFVDINNLPLVKRHVTNRTKFIILESPTNPTLETLDIKAISKFAHSLGLKVVVDNTVATPLVQKPIELGADIVIESLTKAINGHTDAIGGVIATNDEGLFKKIKFLQHTIGAILSPLDCFLILRGLKTLDVRIERQGKNARTLAKFLSNHPKISKVSSFGFLISFKLKTDKKGILRFLKSLRLIMIGHSFGGPETLIMFPGAMMDLTDVRGLNRKDISEDILRLSVGLEDVEDLLNDLRQAIDKLRG